MKASEFKVRVADLRRMAEGRWTLEEIADYYGVSEVTIMKTLRKFGLRTTGRTKGAPPKVAMPPRDAPRPLPVVAPGELLVPVALPKSRAAPTAEPTPPADDEEDWPRMPTDAEIRRHVEEGLSYGHMSEIYDVDAVAIGRRARLIGIRRQAGGQRQVPDDELLRPLIESGVHYGEIGRQFGYSGSAVSRIARRMGIVRGRERAGKAA